MSTHLYAYRAVDSEESDPDEMFDLTTDDPATALREQFPDAEYEFLHEDVSVAGAPVWVFAVYDGGEHVASLYSENVEPAKKAPKRPSATTALSASDVADQLGITAKELRVFLRADGTYRPVTAPGGRGRYQFAKTDVAKIRKAYAAWEKARAASKVERAAALADAAQATAEAITAQEAS